MNSIISVSTQDGCVAPLSFPAVIGLVIASCVLGLIWSAYNVLLVNKIDVQNGIDGESESLVDIPD